MSRARTLMRAYGIRGIKWLVLRYYSNSHRVVTPKDLEEVVRSYLAGLPELGIRLVYERANPKVGEIDEQLSTSHSAVSDSRAPRV